MVESGKYFIHERQEVIRQSEYYMYILRKGRSQNLLKIFQGGLSLYLILRLTSSTGTLPIYCKIRSNQLVPLSHWRENQKTINQLTNKPVPYLTVNGEIN